MSFKGFTLIEVMIALTIFAVIAVSVGRSASIYIKNAARLELKTQALNIAEYELSQVLIEDQFLPAKTTKRDIEIQEREWVITQKVTILPNPNMQQVDISVSEKGDTFGEDYSIVTISGFIGRN
jgi:general secretion pathway protein I